MARIVTTGKNRRPASGGSRDPIVKSAAIAVVAACAAVAVWRFVSPGGAADAHSGGISTSGPSARPSATPASTGAVKSAATAAQADANAPRRQSQPAASPFARQAANTGAPASPNGEPKRDAAPEPAPSAPVVTPREREFFDNDVENTIASVSEPGAEFFGFPPSVDLEEDEIMAFLRRPVEIEEDDDPAAVAAKERTAEFKAAAIKAIEEDGLTFNQFVRDLVSLRNEQAAMREEAYQAMVKILRRDGEAAARDYLNSINPELEAQGLRAIVISPLLLEE